MFQQTAGSKANRWFLVPSALLLLTVAVRAADPGTVPPATSDISDQKLGSVLVFPYYTSSASTPNSHNTRLAITNQNDTTTVTLHRFFIIGSSGAIADDFICLTGTQPVNFLASDADPGVTGYMVIVAVNSATGVPINFNNLSGEADVKLPSGHRASFKAEAIAAISLPSFGGPTATLNFDASAYNRMPRALAMNKIRSRLDGNSTILVLTRITGSYAIGGSRDTIGAISGNLYDDIANAAPFSLTQSSPQLVQTLSNTFPPTSPVLDTMIPAGRTGWLHVAKTTDVGLFGVLLNFNPNTSSSASAFTGGHLLRIVTLSTTNSIVVPITVPAC